MPIRDERKSCYSIVPAARERDGNLGRNSTGVPFAAEIFSRWKRERNEKQLRSRSARGCASPLVRYSMRVSESEYFRARGNTSCNSTPADESRSQLRIIVTKVEYRGHDIKLFLVIINVNDSLSHFS